ncbi:MAG: hypothetical protein WCA81_17240 [Rhizomicrobium sp.]
MNNFENVDLLEFDKLKDEQIGRLAYRDNLFYLTMGIIGGIVATYFAYTKAEVVLLWLPFAMFIVGVAHLTCERRIQDIGLYVRRHLAPRVAAQIGRDPSDVFAWEIFFRNEKWHPWRKRLHQFSCYILYVLSGIVAVGIYLAPYGKLRALGPFEFALAIVDALLIVGVASLIYVFNRFSPDSEILGNGTKPRFSVLKRMFLSFLAAGIFGTAAFYSATNATLPAEWMSVVEAAHLPAPWPLIAAVATAFVVLTIGLVVGRR